MTAPTETPHRFAIGDFVQPPDSDLGAQVVAFGEHAGDLTAWGYDGPVDESLYLVNVGNVHDERYQYVYPESALVLLEETDLPRHTPVEVARLREQCPF